MEAALAGIKVLDFTQMMNGPFGTLMLADYGADVIKVEPPTGDTMRKTGETFIGDDAAFFMTLNRNKRSVVLDLTQPEDRAKAIAIAAKVDVVVENFRPGVAEKLGIAYDDIRAVNPEVVYCTTSAFGREGADARRPGMDPVVQALSGIMQLTGDEHTGPMKTGMPYCDLITPLLSTIGLMAALYHKKATGKGQFVELSMIDATIYSMLPRDAYYFATGGETPARIGNAHWQIVPYNTYLTRDDRHMMIIAHTDKFWNALCEAVGADELLADERLSKKAGRLENRELVDEGLAAIFATQDLGYWNDRLDGSGIMYAPVLSFPEVFEDPRVQRDLVIELDNPKANKIKVIRNPVKLSLTPPTTRRPFPVLGEHTDEVLKEFGIAE